MLYVKWGADGTLEDFSFVSRPGYESTTLSDPRVQAWLKNEANQHKIDAVLEQMDLEMVRVVEDLIDILIDKGLILFTDLPEVVQNKILFKRSLRSSLQPSLLYESDDELLL
ncbi:hypothetical protein SAMN05443662_1636 [Sulfurivirga caldicuralii]|uniref:Tryptophan synthase subunit beta like protein n=1 Tax=Sulfurivirga caldicuralii TaxID=364032 RepID=A0A1N6HB73_9GAMM|nr:hypothetical protein [Sulfurivirga caldicuralii]SIO17006.1 hypothetical protein SAMN05443662_1636 [Sulfurivirga caldicuralii]